MRRGDARVIAVSPAALSLLLALAFAGVATDAIGSPSKLELIPTVRIWPHALPRTELTPVALRATTRIASTDGSHPPALEELTLKLDRDLAIRTTGLPDCSSRGIISLEDWPSTKTRCKDATVGRGRAEISIDFPGDYEATSVNGEVLVVNGGTKAGTTTLYALIRIAIPVPATTVVPVKIQHSTDGRYGSTATAEIPKIAGGSGSIALLAMTIDRKYLFRGERLGVISARCGNDRLRAHVTARFSDDSVLKRTILHPCREDRRRSPVGE